MPVSVRGANLDEMAVEGALADQVSQGVGVSQDVGHGPADVAPSSRAHSPVTLRRDCHPWRAGVGDAGAPHAPRARVRVVHDAGTMLRWMPCARAGPSTPARSR